MPSRLRPKASVAADAILVGDPGRSLLLAQELLDQPRMSNHARGLWGYSGVTPAGEELTIQATGMGAPSAAAVLADLAKLGVRRAIRVGTCVGLAPDATPGRLLAVSEAVAGTGSAASFGLDAGEAVQPDPELSRRLTAESPERLLAVRVGSFDAMPPDPAAELEGIAAADMQTVAVLARGRQLGIAAAAVLTVAEAPAGERLADEPLEEAAKSLGRAAAAALFADGDQL
jgi:uridine phosphorylase